MRSSGRYSSRGSFNRGLTRKFLLTLVFALAVPAISTMFFGYYQAYGLWRSSGGTILQRAAKSLSDQTDLSLHGAIEGMTLLAASTEIREAMELRNKRYKNLSPADISELVLQEFTLWKTSKHPDTHLTELRNNDLAAVLAAVASKNPGFRALRAVDRAGIVVAAFGALDSPYPQQGQERHRSDAVRQGKIVLSEPFFTEPPVSAVVHICVPVLPREPQELHGELHAEYSLRNLIPQTEDDGDQEIVALLPARSGEGGMRILSPPHLASSRPVNFRVKEGDLLSMKRGWSFVEVPQLDVKAVAGFAPLKHSSVSLPVVHKGNEWVIMTARTETDAMAPFNALFLRTLLFIAAMLLLASLSGLAFARRILRPLRALQEGVQEIGRGNLEHRADIRSNDEIEILADEFNRMAERMQRTQEQLQRRSKELEQRMNQLKRLQAQFMQSERMAATGELAAQIAHEINNPLGIIKNYVGIAKMLMPEEDPNRENLKIVDQEINRIAGIVRRLLRFAKPGMEELQSVQINQIIEELLALLRGQLFRSKIEISEELADNLPEVNVSTDQMRQVFLNLIKNAEDAMPDGGKLSIRTRYRKGRVEIDIADDGCGIPPEDVKNIFEPFFTTKGVKGTGLGLSVSYGIVKNYNGEISVESEPNGGTTFTIQLPVISDKVFQVIRSS